MNAKIVGFEGPSLAGKTTLIQGLESRLRLRGCAVVHIEEYTILAGGHERFPPVLTTDGDAALEGARFFLELERQRMRQMQDWLSLQTQESRAFVLVDRLIFTCMAIRRAVADDVGYGAYLCAVRAREVILPDITVFVDFTCPEPERARRMAGRNLFEHWQLVYDPPGYLDLLKEIDATVVRLNLHLARAEGLEDVENLLLALD